MYDVRVKCFFLFSNGYTHHHTDTSSCLGNGPQPIGQVVCDGVAHDRCVSRKAVDELPSSSSVKKSHFLS